MIGLLSETVPKGPLGNRLHSNLNHVAIKKKNAPCTCAEKGAVTSTDNMNTIPSKY